jgi:hypothetical protein
VFNEEYILRKYETIALKVIHRRNRTGFEETKDFPIRINDLVAGRYQVRSSCHVGGRAASGGAAAAAAALLCARVDCLYSPILDCCQYVRGRAPVSGNWEYRNDRAVVAVAPGSSSSFAPGPPRRSA